MRNGIGDRYQEETKYHRDALSEESLDWASKPSPYQHAQNIIKTISLPDPKTSGGAGLFDLLRTRRSRRDFTSDPIELSDLAQLCWAADGVTAQMQNLLLRTAPSAGGLYPVEIYVQINRVTGLEPGVYHLYLPEWSLEAIRLGDYGRTITDAAIGQKMAKNCAVNFCFTIVPKRSKWKYEQRGYRYMYLDAGHIGQNLSLAAEALGFGCCMIGAIFDDELNAILGADGETETGIYIGCVGKVRNMQR